MVWLRATGLQDTMYIRKLSTLNMNVSFRTSQSKADESALIDSGATDNFIDEDTWKRLGIGHKELARPVTVHNVDGTENKQGRSPTTAGSALSKEKNICSNSSISRA
jgi:hypothetical protein